MNKNTANMKECCYCYWFRPYNWHVATAPLPKVSSKYMNRGCTYGYEWRLDLTLPRLTQVVENIPIDGDVMNKRVCSGWRDCGAYEAGVKKGSVNSVDSDKDKYRQWLIEQGIPYEE